MRKPMVMVLLLFGCGHDNNKGPQDMAEAADLSAPPDLAASTSRYAASVAQGDFALWTITDGAFTVTWTGTDTAGGGAAVWELSGTCTAADASYGYRDCTVATAKLTSGSSDAGAGSGPAAGDEYYFLDLPGVAMVAHPKGASGDFRHDLHIGLAVGSCANAGGTHDVRFVRAGAPGNLDILLGRATIVANTSGIVSSVDEWDYGLVVNGASSMNSASDPIRPILLTQSIVPHPLPITGATCDNGVVTLPIPGNTLRGVITEAGVGLLDLPHRPGVVNGTGGVVGVIAGASAALSDLTGKQYSGVMFQEGGKVDLFSATVAADGSLTVVSTLNNTVANNTAWASSRRCRIPRWRPSRAGWSTSPTSPVATWAPTRPSGRRPVDAPARRCPRRSTECS
jgi:hypothetical protein